MWYYLFIYVILQTLIYFQNSTAHPSHLTMNDPLDPPVSPITTICIISKNNYSYTHNYPTQSIPNIQIHLNHTYQYTLPKHKTNQFDSKLRQTEQKSCHQLNSYITYGHFTPKIIIIIQILNEIRIFFGEHILFFYSKYHLINK